MKVVVTGATGYIGERLVRHAVSLGCEVVVASRLATCAKTPMIYFDLTDAAEIRLPDGIDVVFHLAATTQLSAINPDMEIGAARRLIKATEQAGAKFIFVSSQTACENAPTAYGRTKWQIERLVLASDGWVVRPGQVYGGSERGLFGQLVAVVRGLPIIPAFLPAPKIQPVHVDDLVVALLNCATTNNVPSSVLCIGANLPITFTYFLRMIALVRVRRFRLPIPVPVVLVRLVGFCIGTRLRAKLGLDRLTSLFDLPSMETKCDMQQLGMSLRSLASGMARSGDDRRRKLIREGQALLTYVLRSRPNSNLVRRYVRCIESIRGGQPQHLSDFVLSLPSAIAFIDSPAILSTPSGAELVWRLNASVVLAEASVQGARRFLAIGETSGFVSSIVNMFCAVALELWWRVLSLVVKPVLRPALRCSGLTQ